MKIKFKVYCRLCLQHCIIDSGGLMIGLAKIYYQGMSTIYKASVDHCSSNCECQNKVAHCVGEWSPG